jgi:putative endonuclease
MHFRSQLGKQAEKKVGDYLQRQGFKILEYNYRKKHGEIDLIANKANLLVFVEVKMRQHAHFDLSDVITRNKQRKIIFVAKEYIAKRGWQEQSYRFDVALLLGTQETFDLTYIPNAFTEGDYAW